jgi:hypothetical protein
MPLQLTTVKIDKPDNTNFLTRGNRHDQSC